MNGGDGGMEAAKKRRLGIHETTLENDIRYRGRSLRRTLRYSAGCASR